MRFPLNDARRGPTAFVFSEYRFVRSDWIGIALSRPTLVNDGDVSVVVTCSPTVGTVGEGKLLFKPSPAAERLETGWSGATSVWPLRNGFHEDRNPISVASPAPPFVFFYPLLETPRSKLLLTFIPSPLPYDFVSATPFVQEPVELDNGLSRTANEPDFRFELWRNCCSPPRRGDDTGEYQKLDLVSLVNVVQTD